MINFEKWFYTNEKLIEEGIEIDPSTKTLYINKKSDSKNSIVDFFPSQYFYNTNIKDPYRTDNIVDSLFGCYIVNDENDHIPGFSTGNDITSLLYHTFKVGKLTKHNKEKILLDPSYITSDSLDSSYKLHITSKNTPLSDIKSDINTLHSDFINKFELFATNYYNSKIHKFKKFDLLYIPESKSKHVNHFANLIKGAYKIPCETSITEITKIHPKRLYNKILPAKLQKLTKLIHKAANIKLNKNSNKKAPLLKTIGDKLLVLFIFIFINYNTTPIQDLITYLKIDITKLNYVYTCILLSSVVYNWYSADYQLSSANDIRVGCNAFTNEYNVTNKAIDTINRVFHINLTKIPDDGDKRLKYYTQQFLNYIGSTDTDIKNNIVGKLDAYISNYYNKLQTAQHINKNELDILCVDDNTNIGSTVFEITRKLKDEIKGYDKINIHWVVLFLPIKDVNIYVDGDINGELIHEYSKKLYTTKSERRKQKQYVTQLQKFKQTAYKQLCDIIESHNSDNILLDNILEISSLFTESINNDENLLKLCYDIYNDRRYIDFLKNVKYFDLKFNENIQKIVDLIKNNNSEYIKLQQQKTNNHINSLISAFINNISNKTSKSKMNDVYNNLLDTFKQNNYPITGINNKIRKYIRLNYDSNILKQLNNKFEIAISKN